MANISALPNELLASIANAAPADSCAKLSQVSRRFHAVANDSLSWEARYKRDAGPLAYAAALQEPERTWKARYGDIHQTVQHPFMTPPGLAQAGDVVTVLNVDQAEGEDVPCRVLKRASWGMLRVLPMGDEVAGTPQPLWVRPGRCRDGARPFLVPAPMDAFANPSALRPQSEAEILPNLPTRLLFTSALRPGLKVRIHRAALGLSGTPYFMVEEPVEARTLNELVAMYIARAQQDAADAREALGLGQRVRAKLHGIKTDIESVLRS